MLRFTIMAKMKSNATTGELRGLVGDLVFVRHKPGEVIVRRRPIRKAPRRAAELTNQAGFTESVIYAKKIWATQPELKERYDAAGRLQGRQGFQLAKADYRRPPKVQEIDLTGYRGNAGELI